MKIDPKYVHELYKKHNLVPVRSNIHHCGGKLDCCALGIICLENNIDTRKELDCGYKWAADQFGDDFKSGFWWGFDNPNSVHYSENEKEGFLNGVAVRKYLDQFYKIS